MEELGARALITFRNEQDHPQAWMRISNQHKVQIDYIAVCDKVTGDAKPSEAWPFKGFRNDHRPVEAVSEVADTSWTLPKPIVPLSG